MTINPEDLYPDVNEHGVRGRGYMNGYATFVPQCCFECNNFDSEYSEWHGKSFYGCVRNVILPTRKGTCQWKNVPSISKETTK